jgi:hypothetical protein
VEDQFYVNTEVGSFICIIPLGGEAFMGYHFNHEIYSLLLQQFSLVGILSNVIHHG